MIIDTNGFEIGDEVWYIDFYLNYASVHNFIIGSFEISNYGIYGIEALEDRSTSYFIRRNISNLFHTEQECQLACDKLNSK